MRWIPINPFNYFDRIYYINLDSRLDRAEAIEMELIHMQIWEAERISGVVHENPSIGCHLSHAKILEDAIYNGYDRILILEDDAEFLGTVSEAKRNVQHFMAELPGNWDMLYLGANLDVYPAYQVSEHVARLEGAFSTHAIGIRRTLFQKLWEINTDPSTVHNDVTFAQEIHPKYKCYMSIPIIAGQRDSYSDIQKTFMSSNQVFKDRLESNLVRMNSDTDIHNPNDGTKKPEQGN